MSKAFVFLADGFEEIEAISPVDILRRGGIDTLTVSVTGRSIVTGAHGIPVAADLLMEDFLVGEAPTVEDALVFPGGLPGAQTLADCRPLIECLRSHEAAGGVCGAICAAPMVLGGLGLYQPLVDFAGAGASVPLLGFGNALAKGAIQGAKEHGILGAFSGGISATAAGVSAAILFGWLAALIFRPRSK